MHIWVANNYVAVECATPKGQANNAAANACFCALDYNLHIFLSSCGALVKSYSTPDNWHKVLLKNYLSAENGMDHELAHGGAIHLSPWDLELVKTHKVVCVGNS
jgi:hypothetical protein